MKDRSLRRITITKEDIARHPELTTKLSEVSFSEKLKNIFPDMFGDTWAEYMTLEGMVRTFVRKSTLTQQLVLKTTNLTWYCTCKQIERDRFDDLLKEVLPEIRQKMQALNFLP